MYLTRTTRSIQGFVTNSFTVSTQGSLLDRYFPCTSFPTFDPFSGSFRRFSFILRLGSSGHTLFVYFCLNYLEFQSVGSLSLPSFTFYLKCVVKLQDQVTSPNCPLALRLTMLRYSVIVTSEIPF